MTPELSALVASAARDGWAAGRASLFALRLEAGRMGLREIATRWGDPAVSELSPTTAHDAHPASLSAVYGVGPQPLHTDGAHMPAPPDLVILHMSKPSPTPTLLWTGPKTGHLTMWPECVHHGIFLVAGARGVPFFAAARSGRRLRYDPGCMTACDARAREVDALMIDAVKGAHAYEWVEEDQVLVIDNRRTMHARGDATADPDRALTRVTYRLPPKERR